ncbi:MAG: DUF6702 family protein, partial [Bacteroidota bacterium]
LFKKIEDEAIEKELIKLNLWSDDMRKLIIIKNGSVQNIDEIPEYLKKIYKKPIDLINLKDKDATTKILANYLTDHLKFKINNKSVNFKLIGFENEAEAVWMYIECDKSELPKKVEIENSLLYDYLKEQMNIVHIEVNDSKKSLKVSYPEKTLKFDF